MKWINFVLLLLLTLTSNAFAGNSVSREGIYEFLSYSNANKETFKERMLLINRSDTKGGVLHTPYARIYEIPPRTRPFQLVWDDYVERVETADDGTLQRIIIYSRAIDQEATPTEHVRFEFSSPTEGTIYEGSYNAGTFKINQIIDKESLNLTSKRFTASLIRTDGLPPSCSNTSGLSGSAYLVKLPTELAVDVDGWVLGFDIQNGSCSFGGSTLFGSLQNTLRGLEASFDGNSSIPYSYAFMDESSFDSPQLTANFLTSKIYETKKLVTLKLSAS